MNSFAETGLNENLLSAVKDLGFETPTPIQAKTIPHLLNSNQDITALAQTGTGKTAAFGLPSIQKTVIEDKTVQTLVLCPTRELCIQITKDLVKYSKFSKGLNVVSVYGGSSIETQIRELRRGAHIVVGTPGRTKDLIKRRKLKLENVQRVILDEADEMLNMGFKDELDAILENVPVEKQTLLFSATMSKEIRRIANNYMTDPIEVSVARENLSTKNVEHLYYVVNARDKYEVLKRISDINPNIYGIVFCRTRRETKEIANKLMHDGYSSDAIHGDLSQAQRDEVMGRFRNKRLQILVATDVAARGLDIDNLTHVVNFSLPDDSEVYIHRSGRTGRAGKKGISIAITHTRERRKLMDIERKFKINFSKKNVPNGTDICTKQLYSLIDKIEKVEVDEAQIGPFLPGIYEKLESLSREELIKHFVSAEFNRFLAYYKNARDINAADNRKDNRKDTRRDNRRDKRSESRGQDRDRSNRGNKERRNPNLTRFYINAGSKHGLTPVRLIGLINNALDSGDSEIGKIEILKNFSFFEIESKVEAQLISTLTGHMFEKISLVVQVSNEKPEFTSSPKKKFSRKKGVSKGTRFRSGDKEKKSGRRGRSNWRK